MKRIHDRSIRRFLNRWLKLERSQGYTTAHDGKIARRKMFRRALGF